jgi:hypothetical protein
MTPEQCGSLRSHALTWSSLDEWWREVGEAELRLILWAAWDPIGRVPRDEYDWYVPGLWALLREHAAVLRTETQYEEGARAERVEYIARVMASQHRIEEQLSEWRTERMGLSANRQEDKAIADKLTDWLRPRVFPSSRRVISRGSGRLGQCGMSLDAWVIDQVSSGCPV